MSIGTEFHRALGTISVKGLFVSEPVQTWISKQNAPCVLIAYNFQFMQYSTNIKYIPTHSLYFLCIGSFHNRAGAQEFLKYNNYKYSLAQLRTTFSLSLFGLDYPPPYRPLIVTPLAVSKYKKRYLFDFLTPQSVADTPRDIKNQPMDFSTGMSYLQNQIQL